MARQRILQNNLFLWVDGNIDEHEGDTQYTLQRLRAVARHVSLFTQINACMEFLRSVNKEKVLIITSGSMGQSLVEKIHSLPSVEAIFIFCGNVARHEAWAKKWSKIRGVYHRIHSICEAIQTVIKQSNEDLTPISFVQHETMEGGSDVDLNRLEPSFMYTTLFKRIFLDLDHEPHERQALIKFCRAQFHDKNRDDLKIVEEFDRDYHPDQAISWYTRQCFLYEMLNRALRLVESDIIVDMAFFIRDLHRKLEELHHEQFDNYHGSPLTLYRGQGLSIEDFSKLKKTRGGLMAFNSFLSTSRARSISLTFAQRHRNREDMVGILFVMTVNPKIESAIFANIEKHGYFEEKEILFSMNTVFRIGEVIPLEDTQRVFEVRLTLTSDDDPQLRRLTDRMEKDIADCRGWHRVGRVLLDVRQIEKAEELYLTLLEKDPSERDRGSYYHCLGLVKHEQRDYPRAVEYYQQAIAIKEKVLSPTDSDLAASYGSISLVYVNMGEYSQALSYFNKALAIREKTLPPNHPDLAQSYINIGGVHLTMREWSRALSYFNKARDIQEQTLPPNHPDLATSFNNIAWVHHHTGEYSQALSYFNQAIAIREKSLTANHPDLAQTYHSVGITYHAMGEHSRALSYLNKAIAIREKALAPNHPDLAESYNDIGVVYQYIGEYSQALRYYHKVIALREQALPSDHPDLASSYMCFGEVHLNMGEYSQALSYFTKGLAIQEKCLPASHPQLAGSYNDIGGVYLKIGEYAQALSYFNKAIAIHENSLTGNSPCLGFSYNNIAMVYDHMGEYSQALSYYNKALTIWEKALPTNHPDVVKSYNNIGIVYYQLKQYSNALLYLQKALNIEQRILPPGDPHTQSTLGWLKLVRERM